VEIMKKSLRFLYIILAISSVISCSKVRNDNPLDTDTKFTNNQIVLVIKDDYNTFKTSDVISGEIWNESDEGIKFPNNYNIRIFEKTNNGWSELIEKPVTRFPQGDFEFDPSSGTSNIQMIDIFPDLPEPDRNYQLRIYISGELITDGESKEVFAYTDLSLHP
jgi:hypothetical protein